MDLRVMGLDAPLFHSLQHILNVVDDNSDKSTNAPSHSYVQDVRAMAVTPADVKEIINSYHFIIDMPGLKCNDIKDDNNVLRISRERKREEEKKGTMYVRMERTVGKFMKKFSLPENANTNAISVIFRDGVLTVNVDKLPLPKPKKPKTIDAKIA